MRYFSAWEENDHMCIQNEYCEGNPVTVHAAASHGTGGNLEQKLIERRDCKDPFTEEELREILRQMVCTQA